METDSHILVLGHRGLVGSAVLRKLRNDGYDMLFTPGNRDLRNRSEVDNIMECYKPDYVINCAGKVGGIGANVSKPAEFIYDNLVMQSNIIDACHIHNVKKLCFLGSACIYPREAIQPIEESALLSAPLEPTNLPYAVAKISGIIMCQAYRKQYGSNFISVMPNNVYGTGDNFRNGESHVIAGMIRKFYDAKVNGEPSVTFWGDGTPLREFLFADDLADAIVFLMNNYNKPFPVNVASGEEVCISYLAHLIKRVVGYEGDIIWDTTQPNGMMRKKLNIDKMDNMKWYAKVMLEEGITRTYKWFINNYNIARL